MKITFNMIADLILLIPWTRIVTDIVKQNLLLPFFSVFFKPWIVTLSAQSVGLQFINVIIVTI